MSAPGVAGPRREWPGPATAARRPPLPEPVAAPRPRPQPQPQAARPRQQVRGARQAGAAPEVSPAWRRGAGAAEGRCGEAAAECPWGRLSPAAAAAGRLRRVPARRL